IQKKHQFRKTQPPHTGYLEKMDTQTHTNNSTNTQETIPVIQLRRKTCPRLHKVISRIKKYPARKNSSLLQMVLKKQFKNSMQRVKNVDPPSWKDLENMIAALPKMDSNTQFTNVAV